jgi:hypothetical protein
MKQFEKYLSDTLEKLKKEAYSKELDVDYKFLGDSQVWKDDKLLATISRNNSNYFPLASKVKEIFDYFKALEMAETLEKFKK